MSEKRTTPFLDEAIAGLLHDIGKAPQRANIEPWTTPEGFDLAGQPADALRSMAFAHNAVYGPYKAAALAGAYHHSADKNPAAAPKLSCLVALAARLAAGKRADDEQKQNPKQMISIFDQVRLDGSAPQPSGRYLRVGRLALKKDALFPGAKMDEAALRHAYTEMTTRLTTAAGQPIDDPFTYIENMLSAMQQAAWAIPSAASTPNVSLYDHSRMTAALAVCLSEKPVEDIKALLGAVTHQFQGNATESDIQLLKQPAALLIGGDISGVQDFIYTVSAKKAAQTLRGRSFYLQLLTEAVLRFVLSELGLPYSNVIYSGGGHFFLLAPPSAAAHLPQIRRQVTKKLLEHHSVALYLALGESLVPVNGFATGAFPQHWQAMHRNLAEAKQRRYIELGDDFYGDIFTPPQTGGNPDATCAVCGEDASQVTNIEEDPNDENLPPLQICNLCRSFYEVIGKNLPTARFVALGWGPAKPKPRGSALNTLESFGMQVRFLKRADDAIDLPAAQRLTIWALDDVIDKWPTGKDQPTARLLRYTVNQIPLKDNQPITFDTLQEQACGGKGKPGFKRLGVLRMDVDNLGDIFQKGLGNTATLARLSTLSFQMSLFFEGWVKRLCESEDYKGLIYAVYAGGDDLFLIGAWDVMPGLAQSIRQDFAEYTGGNKDLHLSAGMTFIHNKYPVHQAAEDAGQALEQAKSLPGKDAFAFLGQAWKWDDFLKITRDQEKLVNIMLGEEGDKEGPRSLLGTLRQLALDEADARQQRATSDTVVWGPWIWRGTYTFTRLAEQYQKTKPEIAAYIKSLEEDLHTKHYSNIAAWGSAARWAQLLTRR